MLFAAAGHARSPVELVRPVLGQPFDEWPIGQGELFTTNKREEREMHRTILLRLDEIKRQRWAPARAMQLKIMVIAWH